MNHTRRAAEINQAMDHLPSRTPETGDPLSGGGDCEREHESDSDHAGRDEWPLDYILKDFVQNELLIECNVHRQVDESLKEREKAQHSAESNQAAHAGYASERRDRQRDHEE